MIVIYFAAIVVANLTVAHFGPWFSPINAFVLIGLDLVLRDRLHDRWAGNRLALRMGALIIGAGLTSYLINPASGQIAAASCIAFIASGITDATVYQWLRNRGFMVRVNGSNIAGAAVDSLIFPTIAFGALMPWVVLAQFVCKVGGGALWSLVLRK